MNIYKAAAQAHGFYDSPIWDVLSPKPEYFDLFEWSDNPISLSNQRRQGFLKEEMFDTFPKKISYLQGVFEDPCEGHGIIHGKNALYFANSHRKVERCKKWINEIAIAFLPPMSLNQGVVSHNTTYLCPICHTITLNPHVIKFIQQYEEENRPVLNS